MRPIQLISGHWHFSEVFLTDVKVPTRVFLFDKAMSIYSGTTEIQNNIIAKRTLGLLDHQ